MRPQTSSCGYLGSNSWFYPPPVLLGALKCTPAASTGALTGVLSSMGRCIWLAIGLVQHEQVHSNIQVRRIFESILFSTSIRACGVAAGGRRARCASTGRIGRLRSQWQCSSSDDLHAARSNSHLPPVLRQLGTAPTGYRGAKFFFLFLLHRSFSTFFFLLLFFGSKLTVEILKANLLLWCVLGATSELQWDCCCLFYKQRFIKKIRSEVTKVAWVAARVQDSAVRVEVDERDWFLLSAQLSDYSIKISFFEYGYVSYNILYPLSIWHQHPT